MHQVGFKPTTSLIVSRELYLCATTMAFLFQFHKKRRIVGRVRCKNIKTECPKVNCPDPILLPGRCCKVCPGETESKTFRCFFLTICDSNPSLQDGRQAHNTSMLQPTPHRSEAKYSSTSWDISAEQGVDQGVPGTILIWASCT